MNEDYQVRKYTGKALNLEITLPGSKSITNRALILSALASGTSHLNNFLISEDTIYMSRALKEMGIHISYDEEKKVCRVDGGLVPSGEHNLFVGNAGTAMRFLSTYLCTGKGHFILDGDERMRQRPIEDLLAALRQLGCDITSKLDNGCPPVIIRAKGVTGGKCTISGKNSSQYISSILMSAPFSRDEVLIQTLDDISSKPYIDMTISMMESYGVKIERNAYQSFNIKKNQYQVCNSYIIEPDASSASYFLAAGAILKGKVQINGLSKNSLQGDARFADILQKMGCFIEYLDNCIRIESSGKLKGINIDMNANPDLVPTLAVLALFAGGPTKIGNVATLRIKESDRIAALAAELTKIGARVKEYPDGLEIFPNDSYNHALISTYNDHRIAMSFAVAGLRIPGIEISNPKCVSKSFPEFYTYLEHYFNK